jgi:hypothetical protein
MRSLALGAACLLGAASLSGQRPTLSANVRQYISTDAPAIAITNVRVIDGTGAPARTGLTVVIADGRIAAIGHPRRSRPGRTLLTAPASPLSRDS